jgi:predicted RNA binding protein YcfA (HicA-like mRNA interferase family)
MKEFAFTVIIEIPVHHGRTIPPGTLRGIIRDAGLTVEEFVDLL